MGKPRKPRNMLPMPTAQYAVCMESGRVAIRWNTRDVTKMRKLAAWLIKAADWLEAREK